MKHALTLCIAIAALNAFPSAANAQGGAEAGFQISLTIPEVCHLETDGAILNQEEGLATIGVFEMCNSGRGFRVIASHRPLQGGEQVQVNYAGQVNMLDASGISDIAFRRGPIIEEVPVSIQTSGLVQNLAISLGMAVI